MEVFHAAWSNVGKKRTTTMISILWRQAACCVWTLLGIAVLLHGAEIAGTTVGVKGDRVDVQFAEGAAVEPGEMVDLFYILPGGDELEGGRWCIKYVSNGIARASVVKSVAKPRVGLKAVVWDAPDTTFDDSDTPPTVAEGVASTEDVRKQALESISSGASLVKKVWVNHNVMMAGRAGMAIHADLAVVGQQGKSCYASVLFFATDGSALRDKNGRFATVNGQVGCATILVPENDSAQFPDVEFKIPYHELHVPVGRSELQLLVQIHAESGAVEIARSVRYRFFYDRRR